MATPLVVTVTLPRDCPRLPERERQRSHSPDDPASADDPAPANHQCTDEVWQRRSCHRQAGVAAVKRSDDYRIAQAAQVPRPKSPDAADKKLSKRQWESGVQIWRKGLKAVVSLLPVEVEALPGSADEEVRNLPEPPAPPATSDEEALAARLP